MRGRLLLLACVVASSSVSSRAEALDKQGSAHGGNVGGDGNGGVEVTGSVMGGLSILNPSYAARPDNSGRALMRYAGHLDIDLLGRALSVPLDVNVFSDRRRGGAAVFAPSELDTIAGVTTTHTLVRGADLELGARAELDAPVDRRGYKQAYADARARLLYSLADAWTSLKRGLAGGDVSGYATLGWFAWNPSYAARPDNSGNALLRYTGHTELAVGEHVSLGLDGTMFTDRRTSLVRPSELDFTADLIGHLHPFDLHLAYERDMPVDRGGLVQHFVYTLFVYNFGLSKPKDEPRGHAVGP